MRRAQAVAAADDVATHHRLWTLSAQPTSIDRARLP
jgi:hypothetical protein